MQICNKCAHEIYDFIGESRTNAHMTLSYLASAVEAVFQVPMAAPPEADALDPSGLASEGEDVVPEKKKK